MQLPHDLEAEREALIAEIHEAFMDVSREGGVSWSEAIVNDRGDTEEACLAARASDKDQSWTELAYDETWDAGPGIGGWSFLDEIGFRYYLPAAMIRNLEAGYDAFTSNTLDSVLTLHDETSRMGALLREHTLEKWSALNASQRKCVARFIRFMIASEDALSNEYSATDWRKAYESYWKSVEEGSIS